ncbi:hypothetical protein [Persephonella sp.]
MTPDQISSIIDAQDKILIEIGKTINNLTISGSFGLIRAFTQHRVTDEIYLFSQNYEDDLKKLVGLKNLTKDESSLRWEGNIKGEQTIFNVEIDNVPLKIFLIEDPFKDLFGKTKLEINLFLEDIEGIYTRLLLDIMNNSENILFLVDLAYLDDEFHLIDFISDFSEITGYSSFDLIHSLKKSKINLEKDRFKTERILRDSNVTVSSTVLKKWLEAKIEELS